MRGTIALVGLSVALALPTVSRAQAPLSRLDYTWLEHAPARSLAGSFSPPEGFRRVEVARSSFAGWLRGLPLQPDGAPIVLFNGQRRANQNGAAAILDIDVGNRDLQQCADAVIRLRAEYLYASARPVAFNFTSGDRASFADWVEGRTARIDANRVAWATGPRRAADHSSLRQWLDLVFTYAGSLSLQRELKPVADIWSVQAGDVLIQGGSPGHAVIVLDVARSDAGQPAVLLAQSFMPAQSIHVLRNPQGGGWFAFERGQPIVTPDWRFMPGDLRRFVD